MELGKIKSITIGNLTYHYENDINEIKENKCDVTIHFDEEQIKKYIEKQKEILLGNQKVKFIKL
jgi:hypothetical protein